MGADLAAVDAVWGHMAELEQGDVYFTWAGSGVLSSACFCTVPYHSSPSSCLNGMVLSSQKKGLIGSPVICILSRKLQLS